MLTIWIVWWISDEGDSPEITVFTEAQKAQECWLAHVHKAFECDIDEYHIYPETVQPIDYKMCSDALLKIWMENILTDGEYTRIMDRLNKAHKDQII